MVSKERVLSALRSVEDPELGRDVVDLGMIGEVQISAGTVRFTLALTTLACPLRERIVEDARQAVLAI
jgi:ATP-binding protein involved in chromosome partitioning